MTLARYGQSAPAWSGHITLSRYGHNTLARYGESVPAWSGHLYSHIMVTLHLHSVSHNAPAWYGHICYMQSVLGVECLAPV